MPLSTITSVVVMLLVAIFFVSGADAASIVMGTLSERGTLAPSRKTVIFWGAATGAVAAVMLLVGGEDALSGLQNITIVAALPFLLVMIGLAVALVKDLSNDPLIVRGAYAVAAVEQAVVAGVTEHGDDFTLTFEESAPGEGVGRPRSSPTTPSANLPSSARVLPHREPLNRCTTEPTYPWSHENWCLRGHRAGRLGHARTPRRAGLPGRRDPLLRLGAVCRHDAAVGRRRGHRRGLGHG